MNLYTALWYDKFGEPPSYFPIDTVEAETPELALSNNLHHLVREVKEIFELDDISDEDIQRAIYILRDDCLVSIYSTNEQA